MEAADMSITPKSRRTDPIEKYYRPVGKPRYHGFPSPSPWDELADKLRPRRLFMHFREIERDLGGGRVLVDGHEMTMLGGYSYLGLNGRPEIDEACKKALADFGTGTHGSRWLAGHTSLHAELESELARHHGREDAVIFSSGYVANVATISTLLSRHDMVFSDRKNHASILDGCRFAGSKFQRFAHNDPNDLDRMLEKSPPRTRKLVVIDGVFSMSGDVAGIPAIAEVSRRHNAALMVDECHSHFILGPNGGGVRDYFQMPGDDITIDMGTLSKAIPSNGGYIASSADICTNLRRAARGFIYSGSTSAVMIAAALESLRIIEREGPQLLAALEEKRSIFSNELRANGVEHTAGPTPIVPIHVGPAVTATLAAQHCHEEGVFIHAVAPPVVERGKSIMRATVMANHDPEDLRRAAKIIARAIEHARRETTDAEASCL
jgi:8-amino-7-oxononanoate synthase